MNATYLLMVTKRIFMIIVPRIKLQKKISIIFIMDPVMKTGGTF